MDLSSPECRKLTSLIKNSFRVRKNQRPLFVDVGSNLERIGAPQHQVVFGRRGSGKSCLLVHYLNTAESTDVFPVYILADEYKRLTYPDILIRLLIEILESLPVRRRWLKVILRKEIPTHTHAASLRRLLDMADESEIVEDRKQTSSSEAHAAIGSQGLGSVGAGFSEGAMQARQSRFREKKIEMLERHLRDYKIAIAETIDQWPSKRACILLDDFYLMPRLCHPDIIDYLHRLLRDTEVYLKVATIRHRTTLLRNHPHTIGVELAQDVEEIDLDRTLEDLGATQDYLGQMLNSIGQKAGIENVVSEFFNPDAQQELTLTSGGVPRDFFNIFVNAIESALDEGKPRWLTPRHIYKGAGRLAYQTKLKNLRDDAGEDGEGLDRLLVDLLHFCLKEKRKTAFLISQDEAQAYPREHDLIQQLMDFKLIHVVEPDTSAASGRPGRYEAYTLDFSLFMEPRRRDIEIVEFWKIDENRRRTGIREAPVYSLERAGKVFADASKTVDPEVVLRQNEALAEQMNSQVSNPSQNRLF